MGGANLEVWKFGFYTLFPLATLYYFSDDDWYNKHVVPYGKKIWPEYEKTNRPPHTQQEIQAELARMKANRQSISPPHDPSGSRVPEPNVSTLSHEMRAAASAGIFGLGEGKEEGSSPSPSTSPTATTAATGSAEERPGDTSSTGTSVRSGGMIAGPGSGLGWRTDEAKSGRIGNKVDGWREADRGRLV